MNKIAVATVVLVLALTGAYLLSWQKSTREEAAADYKNLDYMIDGESVRLEDGISELESVPGSAAKVVTRYFGNLAKGDINGDGIADLAFLLTRETGGSGTFFYVVGAVQKPDGSYVGSDAVLLGDRIAPQTTEIQNGLVIVNYADRAPGESMSAQPSIGKSVRLKLDPGSLMFGLVANDFEGEANPAVMRLDMKKWEWISAQVSGGATITPKTTGQFIIAFKDGRFSAETDCNSMSGTYTAEDSTLRFGPIAMTKKFCEGSQEGDFAQILESAARYRFTSRGELILELGSANDTATFR